MGKTTHEIRHPEVTVQLTGVNGNAFALIGTVSASLKAAGVSPGEIAEFRGQATSGDYDNLLNTIGAWVTVI